MATEGWHGWDDYARFYDWENARTMGRQDVRFWQDFARREGAPVLELGCGTGRVLVPVARTGVPVVGIDRSEPMLDVRAPAGEAPARGRPARADPRATSASLPFAIRDVLGRDGALRDPAVAHEGSRTWRPRCRSRRACSGAAGRLGVDLVPDLPAWDEYRNQTRLMGRLGPSAGHVTLIESVRQDRRRKLTIFDQEYVEKRGRRTERHRFSLTFRTLPLPQMVSRVEKAGFRVTAVLGDYRGRAWDLRADVWLLLASRR